MISTLFVRLCEVLAEVHGKPMPAGLLVHESHDRYKIIMNNTDSEVENLTPFDIRIERNGWPLGIVAPMGGCLMSGWEDGNAEQAMLEWCDREVRELAACNN